MYTFTHLFVIMPPIGMHREGGGGADGPWLPTSDGQPGEMVQMVDFCILSGRLKLPSFFNLIQSVFISQTEVAFGATSIDLTYNLNMPKNATFVF